MPTLQRRSEPQRLPTLPEDYPDPSGTVCIPKGCRHCHQLGYRGRLPIFELLTFDESVRQMAAQGSDTTTLRQYATSLGMRSLRDLWLAGSHGGEDDRG